MSATVVIKRPILLTTPLGEDKLFVRTIQGEERLSTLFRYTLELISPDDSLDFSKIVGKPITISMDLSSGTKHYLNGIVGRFVQAGKNVRFTTYYADVHPWLWLLTMNSDCRIFQNKTVPEIIKSIFSDLGFTDVKDSLTGTYEAREFCVQYMESSFDFVCRLMEEEGIFYFFEHDSSSHKLVLADDASAHHAVVDHPTVNVRGTESTWDDEGSVDECTLEQQVVVGQFKTDDYNFETPSTDLLATASAKETARSLYEYPGGALKKDPAESHAKLVLQALEVPGKILRGTGACTPFRAGYKFTLAGHHRSDVNAAYILNSISFRSDQNGLYSNTFDAFPASVTFRPPRVTPKPRVHGAQTALVVGKSGEEIWTDKYGRIKVHFHWDQQGKKNEEDSCWVRVAQGWAGKQWGSMFLPRIGQEVIVSFLEGNPDRPIVTGCVYNAEQTVPYTLPDDGTKSTIKSNSSKGGGGFNEIRFEDKKDSEEIFMQAQKDLNLVVLNDETDKIKNNRTVTIQEKDETLIVDKGNRTVKVNTGNETHEVKGTRDLTVTGNETHTNKANYDGKVTGNFTLKVDGNISIEASGSVSIKAGTSFANEAGTSFGNKAGTDLKNEAQMSLTNKAGTTLENNAQMTLTNKAGMSMTNDGGISLTNKGSATQTVDGGGILILKGGLVKIN